MIIKCRDLLPIIQEHGGRLIGGEKGLDKIVSWTYVVVTQKLSQWLRGGEFLIIPNLHDEEKPDALFGYLLMAKECSASGVAIWVGSKSIPELPDKLDKYADELELPLFWVDSQDKVIDYTKDLGNFLVTSKNINIEEKNILLDLLYHQIFNENEFRHRLNLINHNFELPNRVVAIEVQNGKQGIASYYLEDIGEFFKDSFDDALFIIQNSTIIMIVVDLENNIERKLDKIFKEYIDKGRYYNINIGLGEKITELNDYQNSYAHAMKMLEMVRGKSFINKIASYEKVGMHYYIISNMPGEELIEYCNGRIGKLLRYDQVKMSDLMKTFEVFFNNRYNLSQTAADLYIHRNTLLHRLEMIEKLLECKLEDAMTCLDIMNSILLYKFVKG